MTAELQRETHKAEPTTLVYLCAESLSRAGFSFCCFFFAIFGRRGGFQRAQKPVGDGGDFVNRSLERRFIGLGRLVESGDLSYKLERSSLNFFSSYWRVKVEKRFDVSAHLSILMICFAAWTGPSADMIRTM
jgi:hypothetical protein